MVSVKSNSSTTIYALHVLLGACLETLCKRGQTFRMSNSKALQARAKACMALRYKSVASEHDVHMPDVF